MAVQWVLVAQQAGAKLFQSTPSGMRLTLLRDFPHPAGRLRDQEMGTEKPSSTFRGANSAARSSTDSENTPHDHQAEVFALSLARVLDEGRTGNQFDQVVLVAEPRFLGKLKAALSRPTSDKVIRTISKDMANITGNELQERLTHLIAV